MKRSVMLLVLLSLILSFAFAFSSCDPLNQGTGDDTGNNSPNTDNQGGGDADSKCEHTIATKVENEVKATCTTDGSYDEVAYCTKCDVVLERTAKKENAKGHVSGRVAIENFEGATCSEGGSYDRVEYCAVCGNEISREAKISEPGAHIPGKAVVENIKEATCLEAGSYDEVVYCAVCKNEISRVTKTTTTADHTWIPATYQSPKTCSICGETDGTPRPASEGLLYALNEDGKSYSVMSKGSCEDTDIIIPSVYEGLPVTNVSDYAFCEVQGVKSVVIPDSVVSIGREAFIYCNDLENVVIGSGVTSIGEFPFICSNLAYIQVDESNSAYKSMDGTLYTKDGTVLIRYSPKNPQSSYVIPEGVNTIKSYAFCVSCNLTNVTIPNSVTSIGAFAFARCDRLWSVIIPDSVESIGEEAFSSCDNLKSVTIGSDVTSIGYDAFFGCASLVEVINHSELDIALGTTTHGGVAYYAKEIHAEESKVVNSDEYLFYTYNGVDYLIGYVGVEIELVLPESYNSEDYDVFECAFYGCNSLTSVIIPECVTSIGNYAFYNCTSLTSIIIPDSVISIGDRTFQGCTSLTSITIPDSVTSIGNDAFYNCTSLTSITIPDSVTSIGNYAFYNCTSLTSIIIPDSVTSIGSWAFYNCTSLTSITIGKGVTSIDYNAFKCDNLKDVYISDIEAWFNISFGDVYSYPNYNATLHILDNRGREITELIIPDGVTGIPRYALYNCSAITSIVIPPSVTSIGHQVFYNCSNLKDVYISDIEAWCNMSLHHTSPNNHNLAIDYPNRYATLHILDNRGREITKLVIPESITNIPQYAFCNARFVTDIEISKTVTSCGTNAFEGCTIKNAIGPLSAIPQTGCEQLETLVINGGTTVIGLNDFTNLKSVIIGDSVTSIDYAFNGCVSLESVVIPDSVTSIDDAFNGCIALESVVIPSGKLWNAFNECTNLKEVIMGHGVTTINVSFSNNSNLKSITIGNGITAVEDSFYRTPLSDLYIGVVGWLNVLDCFYNTDIDVHMLDENGNEVNALNELVIPEGVTSIPDYAFYKFEDITSIVIPESLTNIGEWAFYSTVTDVYISSIEAWINNELAKYVSYVNLHILDESGNEITELIIPDSVTSISDRTFQGCTSLTSITIPNSVTSIGDGAFSGCTSLTSITIPDSVTSIGIGSFSGCRKIENICVDEDNTVYTSMDGNLYTKDEKTLVQYAAGKKDNEFVIPNSITNIGDGAFAGCINLMSITIPYNVTSIGYGAFIDCISLNSIIIPESVTSIGYLAFYGCSNLTIYCEATEKPDGWNEYWNPSYRPEFWGYNAEK